MEGAWLALTFVLTSLLATTAVPSLPLPFALFPLMLMSGILVMHRLGVVHGAVWLVLAGVVLELVGTAPGRVVAYGLAAIVGVVATERVFAKRSVYALLGLGFTTGAAFVLYAWAQQLIGSWLNRARTEGMSFIEAIWTLALLTVGLYIGFTFAVVLRRWFEKTFVVRSL